MNITEQNVKLGLHVPCLLAQFVNGYLMAQVQNNTDITVHLSPGTKISYSRPCDSEIAVFKVNVPPVAEPLITQTSLRKLNYGTVDLWLKRQIYLSPLLHILRFHLARYLAPKLRKNLWILLVQMVS